MSIRVTIYGAGEYLDGEWLIDEIDSDTSDPENPCLKLWYRPDANGEFFAEGRP